MSGSVWSLVGLFSHNLNNCGFAVIALFITAWVGSYILYRFQRLDDVEVRVALERDLA
jgi:high-affinity nickel-transport protein